MRQLHTGSGNGKVERGYTRIWIYGRIITGDAADAWGLMQHLTNVTDWRRQDTHRKRERDRQHVCVCVSIVAMLYSWHFVVVSFVFSLTFSVGSLAFFPLSLSLCAHLWNLFFAYVVIIYSKCWNNRHNLPRVKRVARTAECRWKWKGEGGWGVYRVELRSVSAK